MDTTSPSLLDLLAGALRTVVDDLLSQFVVITEVCDTVACPDEAVAMRPLSQHWIEDAAWAREVDVVVGDTARKFFNADHYALNFADLKSELLVRLVKCAKLDTLHAEGKRLDFFRYAKTVANNRARTLVTHHMATHKRAGDFTNGKPVHLSLDDPDYIAPAEVHAQTSQEAPDSPDWIDDIATLTVMERLILTSIMAPSRAAMTYAQFFGRGAGKDRRNVDVKYEHHAQAIGLPVEEFQRILDGTKPKIMAYKHDENDTVRNRAIAALEEAFNVHVPRDAEPTVVRRLMTIAARDNFERLTDPIKGHLVTIGARVPELTGGTLRCFGVLYSSRERSCAACGLRVACATEAKNFGLDEILLAPSLVGALAPRTPTAIPRADMEVPAFASARDEILWTWMVENLEQYRIRNSFWFRAEAAGGVTCSGVSGLLFEVGGQGHVRFCAPTAALARRLAPREGQSFLPDSATVDEAVGLFNEHVQSVYSDVTA